MHSPYSLQQTIFKQLKSIQEIPKGLVVLVFIAMAPFSAVEEAGLEYTIKDEDIQK